MLNQETIKLLLLEDDPDDQRLLAKKLSGTHHHVVTDWAQTLASALEKLSRQSYDIVLTDLSVPDSVGLETVSNLRKKSGTTPIIVLTSLDDEVLEKDILDVGAQDYLVKGEVPGRIVMRSILHAVQRQQTTNEMNDLVVELEHSQQLLRQQALLLKKKNRRLRQLYGAAQEFVDNVSHDFRTPLTVIKDYVNIIREGMVGQVTSEQHAMLSKVAVRADDLNNMVDDLLDVSKLDAGLLGAWRRNITVQEIVDRAASLLAERAQVKGVNFTVACDPDLPEVYCDAEKAGRVITNLAVNAIKFAGEHGEVRLWVEDDPVGNQIRVGVTDNGPGLDTESLARIFKRFQQVNSHVASSVKGFGLGLNIAQKLVRLNLGDLSVNSRVGKGSTFSFTLPYADPTEVSRRWLSTDRQCNGVLRMLHIRNTENPQNGEANDFDSFLNCSLRSDDLLFRLTRTEWMLLQCVPHSEGGQWFQRIEQEFNRHNRNRPLGPLPKYEARVCRQWDSQEATPEMLEEFEEKVQELVGASDGKVCQFDR
ncbi:hybrid sensor histidine kinase/response regulator [Aeoliella mucimassa]|uniref:histidine kinase n=1 Tax=Aeoliella mucimassa TaxID=2527972 RepID=A0A518ARH7_9BACT|nr:hybrid sensor histidine kinase/response regulator [Aeoliella mucimassa]QDU57327.1 Non-motile and phage-resistance protein [Aeoliella mucimassa]